MRWFNKLDYNSGARRPVHSCPVFQLMAIRTGLSSVAHVGRPKRRWDGCEPVARADRRVQRRM